jgi:hypothetical protein
LPRSDDCEQHHQQWDGHHYPGGQCLILLRSALSSSPSSPSVLNLTCVGCMVGSTVGAVVGPRDGISVGVTVGESVGVRVGKRVGASLFVGMEAGEGMREWSCGDPVLR